MSERARNPVDLHTHSAASDGADLPCDLVERAAAAGIEVLGVTDHDTVSGLAEAAAAADRAGIRFIPGVEISTSMRWAEPGRSEARLPLHLLGYGFDLEDRELRETLAGYERARVVRIGQMIERINTIWGWHSGRADAISPQRVLEIAGPIGVIGRPHLAQAMVEAGMATTISDAFDRYLDRGRPGYVRRAPVETEAMIRLVRRAGGVPVLAHPAELLERGVVLDQVLPALKSFGLMGMETVYGEDDEATRARLARAAADYGLVGTGGSDYHGLGVKPTRPLGLAPVPRQAVDDLLAAMIAARETRDEFR
ncbi:MAG: PHP domain-containing protein [Chloroflexota bacterium]